MLDRSMDRQHSAMPKGSLSQPSVSSPHSRSPSLAGVGFQTKQRYLFGWFSMKLKLVGNDSAGVVTAYYVRRRRLAAPSFLPSLRSPVLPTGDHHLVNG
jgi:hypothetical protein